MLRESHAATAPAPSDYAKVIESSKRVRWEIDADVIQGRQFDLSQHFLPEGLSCVSKLGFLTADEQRFLSQVQGRSYANIFALVERFIAAKMLEVSREHWLADQVALEALVRFSDEELKHQALFYRIEEMLATVMPEGYVFVPEPNAVARVVLGKSTWAVLALTCHIEIFTQKHYRESIDKDERLSPLWKDVFLFHWKEESQHAILDELEWAREDSRLTEVQREHAIADFIELVEAVDGILQAQATSDAAYFGRACGRVLTDHEHTQVEDGLLKAYRWQYIISGVQEERFASRLSGFVSARQLEWISQALAPIARHVNAN